MRLGCALAALAMGIVVGLGAWYVYVDVPRNVIFQAVPEKLAASRSFSGVVGDPCGAVVLALNDRAIPAFRHDIVEGRDPTTPGSVVQRWTETPYSPRHRKQWNPWCLNAAQRAQAAEITQMLDSGLALPNSFVKEDDEGIVVVDVPNRRILHEFFYK